MLRWLHNGSAGTRTRTRTRARAGTGASWLVATALLVGGPAAAGSLPEVSAYSGWEVHERNDDPAAGWVLYKRRLADSDFEAFRLEAVIDAPPDLVASSFRKNISDPRVSQRHARKTVLRDEDDVVVVYSYIDMPLVSDRDVISRCERDDDPEQGGYRYRWFATDEGPAPLDGVIRLEKSDGSWEFRPAPGAVSGDRTFAVYESHTEVGGAIPAWLVNSLMLDTVVDGVVKLRARVDQDLRRSTSGVAGPISKSH